MLFVTTERTTNNFHYAKTRQRKKLSFNVGILLVKIKGQEKKENYKQKQCENKQYKQKRGKDLYLAKSLKLITISHMVNGSCLDKKKVLRFYIRGNLYCVLSHYMGTSKKSSWVNTNFNKIG
jgi:hypothetical protein